MPETDPAMVVASIPHERAIEAYWPLDCVDFAKPPRTGPGTDERGDVRKLRRDQSGDQRRGGTLIRSIAACEKVYLPEYLATVMSRERMTGYTELRLTLHQTVLYIRTLAPGQRPLLYDGSSRRYGGSRAEHLIRAGVA